VVAQAGPALAETPERLEQTAAAGGIVRGATWAAAGTILAAILVIAAEAEEPHEPQDQQADVENAEADDEDPPLGGHALMVRAPVEEVNPPPGDGLQPPYFAVGLGFGTKLAV